MQQKGHYLNQEDEFSRIQAMIACSNACLDLYSDKHDDLSQIQALLGESLERLARLKNEVNQQSRFIERDRAIE